MEKERVVVNWRLAAAVVVACAAMLAWALFNLRIDTDILSSLPAGDRAITDARHIFQRHPIQDQIVVDLSLESSDPDLLVDCAAVVETLFRQSGLFSTVGLEDMQTLVPELLAHVSKNLPILFTETELRERIEPLLEPRRIEETLRSHMESLMNLEGVGSADFIARDPLGFSGIVMEKMSSLAPSHNASFYRGHLLSSDGKSLLIVARPEGSSMDSAVAARLADLINRASGDAGRLAESRQASVTLTPVGAFRASLDNERAARSDIERAVLFATAGIMLLLIFSFPRPYMGLLALVPALAGTVAAFFTFSLLYREISVMALGFGGAVISISADHGIAYLLFLDRNRVTTGHDAAREVRAVGMLAAMTSVGAFLSLYLSGFSILVQIGLFAAMGIAYSFLFIHLVFSRMFPYVPAARGRAPFSLLAAVNRAALAGGRYKLAGALLFAAVMALFARPVFTIDLNAMNSVSDDTLEAEKFVADRWGNVFDRVHVMIGADDKDGLTGRSDSVTAMLEGDAARGAVAPFFSSAMVFPGAARAQDNFTAWRNFWGGGRATQVRDALHRSSLKLGFVPAAFNQFYAALEQRRFSVPAMPDRFHPLFGFDHSASDGSWVSFLSLRPGPGYESSSFFKTYSGLDSVWVFDPKFFSLRLGNHLSHTFTNMMAIICVSVTLLVFFFFLDAVLTAVALLPVLFAMISTLGTLNILGHPFGIPELMLSIIIVGMGVDYSLYLVRSAQRYEDPDHTGMGLVRGVVFLASMSTLIGFGALLPADHSLLRGAGLACFFGIGYSLVGAFVILPPLLASIYGAKRTVQFWPVHDHAKRRKEVNRRYRRREAHARVFARIKMLTDPLFEEIDRYLTNPRVVLDIGSGYGVPAAWILSSYPEAVVYGLEPDFEKAWVASKVLGPGGWVKQGSAPHIPPVPRRPDTALMLDMAHHLDDEALDATLDALRSSALEGHRLVMRMTVPGQKKYPLLRWIEDARFIFRKVRPRYRSIEAMRAVLENHGYTVMETSPSGRGREEFWIAANAGGAP